MYFFVMYNLSGIQKGIQAGHAAVEYGLKYGGRKVYKNFAQYHKTFILLDGGGSEDMKLRMEELESFEVDYATFYEPDLNNSLSAIAFIVPESVYGLDIKGLEDVHTNNYKEIHSYVEFARHLKSFKLASN